MQYYDDVAGGTQGGWTPEKEAEVRDAIESGLRVARRTNGQTIGQRMLAADSMMDSEYVKMLERKANGVPMHQHNELINHVAASRREQIAWGSIFEVGVATFVLLTWQHVSQTTRVEDAVAAAFITALAAVMLTLSRKKRV